MCYFTIYVISKAPSQQEDISKVFLGGQQLYLDFQLHGGGCGCVCASNVQGVRESPVFNFLVVK